VRDAKTPEGAASTLTVCTLIERALSGVPATFMRSAERREELIKCRATRRRALHRLGAKLLEHAGVAQANLLLRAAESLLEQACDDVAPDVDQVSALLRCRGMLSVLGNNGERHTVVDIELGDGWSYEVASSCLLVPRDISGDDG
jgi:hypothetical protein